MTWPILQYWVSGNNMIFGFIVQALSRVKWAMRRGNAGVNVMIDSFFNGLIVLIWTVAAILMQVMVPYAPGTCPALLKWKPAEMNTVDFKLEATDGQPISLNHSESHILSKLRLCLATARKCTPKSQEFWTATLVSARMHKRLMRWNSWLALRGRMSGRCVSLLCFMRSFEEW